MHATGSRSDTSVSTGAGTDDLGTRAQTTPPLESEQRLDIEHALVADNPREWTDARKVNIIIAHPEKFKAPSLP